MQVESNGFTLIEIMVVILIISVTIGFAMLSVGDFGETQKIDAFAEHFKHYLTLVKQEAMIESNTLGIQMNKQEYNVLRFQESHGWQTMKQGLFQHQPIPANIVLEFKGASSKQHPSIIIDASGDMNAFELHIGSVKKPNRVILRGHTNGLITDEKSRI